MNRKQHLAAIWIGLAAFVLTALVWQGHLLDAWEGAVWNLRARMFARPSPQADRIKLILLDQSSLAWGQEENGLSWPWPREVYVPLLQFCRRGGARSVAFDVLITEPSGYGVSDDQALGQAVQDTVHFIGALYLSTESRSGLVTEWPDDLPRVAAPSGIPDAWDRPTAAFPVPEMAAQAWMLANVQEAPDEDGVFRRAALLRRFDGQAVPSPGLALYLAEHDLEPADLEVDGQAIRAGDRTWHLDREGRGLLRFRKGTDPYETYTAAAVIRSELQAQAGEKPQLDPGIFRDAHVLFGFSAPGLKDLRPTPLHPSAPGVLVHATLLDNLITGDLMRRLPRPAGLLAALLLTLGAAYLVAGSRGAGAAVLRAVLLLLLPVFLSAGLYHAGWWYPLVPSVMAVNLAVFGALGWKAATEGRQKRFIKNAFRHYLSPDVIEEILLDPSRLQLGGVRREVTLLFGDLRGFSTFSERLDPEDLTALLNDFLSAMTAAVQEQGGTVDKYIGDAIVAFWNAPLEQADHPVRAVRAALDCQARLAELRPGYQDRFGVDLHLRIGLHTGPAVVGNMGAHERFDYTVLGDAVNLASRLEGVNKVFGTGILASEATWRALDGVLPGREVGRVRVVGRREPTRVFEPFGVAAAGRPEDGADYAKGLEALYAGQLQAARTVLERLAEHDAAACVVEQEIRRRLAGGDLTWDGTWNLNKK